jgi:hypothetical protein
MVTIASAYAYANARADAPVKPPNEGRGYPPRFRIGRIR